jgi:hypothetical protein
MSAEDTTFEATIELINRCKKISSLTGTPLREVIEASRVVIEERKLTLAILDTSLKYSLSLLFDKDNDLVARRE